MRTRMPPRGFTLVEMLVAMTVMAIVMSLAALAFKYVIFAHLFAESHLSSEEQARVAMAKVTGIARQASIVDDGSALVTPPPPPFSEPAATPGSRLAFTQAAALPTDMPTPGGRPVPCYNKVQIYFSEQNGAQTGELLEQIDPDVAASPCPNFDYSNMPRIVARNVQAFSVEPLAGAGAFATGYRIDISTMVATDNANDQRAGALYHLSSVISPLVFGAAQ